MIICLSLGFIFVAALSLRNYFVNKLLIKATLEILEGYPQVYTAKDDSDNLGII